MFSLHLRRSGNNRLNTSILFCLFAFFLVSSMLVAQPTNIITPLPCDGPSSWSGPKYYRICSDTVTKLQGAPAESLGVCCYTVQYYDRHIYSMNHTVDQYETNITAIFYDGEDCERRKKSLIVQEFQEALYKKLSSDNPHFFAKETSSVPYSVSVAVYTTGGCFQTNGTDIIYDENGKPINCDNSSYCCQRTKQLELRQIPVNSGNFYVLRLDSLVPSNPNPVYEVYKSNGQLCSNPCKAGCENVMMEPTIAVQCGAPCNDQQWSAQKTKIIPVPWCPNCNVEVKFRTRTTSACPSYNNENANDIYLDNMSLNNDPTNPCSSCALPTNTVYEAIVNNLINTEFPNKPFGRGVCKDYYRLFQSACWHDTYKPSYIQNIDLSNGTVLQIRIPAKRAIIKCAGNNCCLKIFRLCNDANGVLITPPTQLGPSQYSSGTCEINADPFCIFTCE